MQGNTKKKIAPVIITVIVLLYVGPLVGGVMVAVCTDVGGSVLLPFLLTYALVGGAVIGGILLALFQRLKEIDGGEEEDAKKY